MSNFTWSDYGWNNTIDSWLQNGWNNTIDSWMQEGWNNTIDSWMQEGWNNTIDSWMQEGWSNYGTWRNTSWSDDSDYEEEEEEEENDNYEPYDDKYSWTNYESSYKETKKSYPYYKAPSTSPEAAKVFNLIFDIVSLVINAIIIFIFLGMPSAYPAEEKPLYAFLRLIIVFLALVIKPLKRQWWMLIVIVPIFVWSLLAVIFPISAL